MELLQRMWPFVRVLVAARLAEYLKAEAARIKITLTDKDAAALAALIIAEITDLLDRRDNPETAALIEHASVALGVVEPA